MWIVKWSIEIGDGRNYFVRYHEREDRAEWSASQSDAKRFKSPGAAAKVANRWPNGASRVVRLRKRGEAVSHA